MKLEQNNDKSLLFSSTEIPDVFFTDTLPSLSSDSVKVYLYVKYLAKFGKDIEINDLSKQINMPLSLVQEAFTNLESSGIITKLPDGYSVVNLQEQHLISLYSPKVTSSVEDIKRSTQNTQRSQAAIQINDLFFNGVMSPSWFNDIDLWFNKYGFSDEVMVALFGYAAENNALNRGYIQTVAEAWAKDGIKTFDDLEAMENQKEKNNKVNKKIAQKLGLKRALTSFEIEFVQKWTDEYQYNLDIIEEALKKSTNLSNINFNYYDAILTDWHNKGLITLDDVVEYNKSKKDKDKKIKEIEKKSPVYNYTQSTFENMNLNDLYEN